MNYRNMSCVCVYVWNKKRRESKKNHRAQLQNEDLFCNTACSTPPNTLRDENSSSLLELIFHVAALVHVSVRNAKNEYVQVSLYTTNMCVYMFVFLQRYNIISKIAHTKHFWAAAQRTLEQLKIYWIFYVLTSPSWRQ